MRDKEEVVREFVQFDPSSLDNILETLRFKRERLLLEVFLDIRDQMSKLYIEKESNQKK